MKSNRYIATFIHSEKENNEDVEDATRLNVHEVDHLSASVFDVGHSHHQ